MILTVLNLSIIFNSIGSNSSTKCKYALLLNLLLDNYILIFIILLFTILLSILIPLYIYKTLKRKFDSHYYSYKVNLQIKNLPISSYSSIKEKLTNNECSICLSCYEENDEVCVLKCDHHHHFHKPCIF